MQNFSLFGRWTTMSIWRTASATALVCGALIFSGAAFAQQAGKAPPKFPPNYRILIAAEVGPEYLLLNGSGPKISAPQAGRGLLFANIAVCVQVAPSRSYRFFGTRSLYNESDKVEFKKQRFGGGCFGDVMGPFPELEQIGHRLRACAARGERRCLMVQTGGRRIFGKIPAKLMQRRSQR